MADKEATNKLAQAAKGDNLGPIKEKVKKLYDRLLTKKGNRQSVNADIQSIRDELPTLGIPKEAFDMAVKYANWDEDKRRGFDFAYQLVREAIGLPVQADMFDEPSNVHNIAEAKKNGAGS